MEHDDVHALPGVEVFQRDGTWFWSLLSDGSEVGPFASYRAAVADRIDKAWDADPLGLGDVGLDDALKDV